MDAYKIILIVYSVIAIICAIIGLLWTFDVNILNILTFGLWDGYTDHNSIHAFGDNTIKCNIHVCMYMIIEMMAGVNDILESDCGMYLIADDTNKILTIEYRDEKDRYRRREFLCLTSDYVYIGGKFLVITKFTDYCLYRFILRYMIKINVTQKMGYFGRIAMSLTDSIVSDMKGVGYGERARELSGTSDLLFSDIYPNSAHN